MLSRKRMRLNVCPSPIVKQTFCVPLFFTFPGWCVWICCCSYNINHPRPRLRALHQGPAGRPLRGGRRLLRWVLPQAGQVQRLRGDVRCAPRARDRTGSVTNRVAGLCASGGLGMHFGPILVGRAVRGQLRRGRPEQRQVSQAVRCPMPRR